ncbi:porin [Vibrio tubiashii]|uniref:porin n=1 Tax=Vibrio tubiashii TaxID=29498 RepID=UPI00349EC5BC
MKKTLVALSVLAAASAQAGIEIYNQDGVTVNLKGDIEVTYQNSKKSSSMTQQIEDADFGFDVRYAMNDQVSFGAYWEFDGSSSNNAEDTKNGDTYVALYTQDFGSFKVGRLCTAIDDAGIDNSDQFGVNAFFDNSDLACGDEALRYDYDNGSFYGTLAYRQNKLTGSTDNATSGEDNSYIDAKAGYRVADFDFTVFYADAEQVSAKLDETLLALEVRYGGFENINLEAAYYNVDIDTAGTSHDNRTYAVAADYTLDKWTFSTGYSDTEYGVDKKDETVLFGNVAYALAPNTKAYVEIAKVDSDKTTIVNDNLAAIGVEASF